MRTTLLTISIALWLCVSPQSAPQQAASAPRVVVKRLAPPVYPLMAAMANFTGDVTIRLSIRPDGSIESVKNISGLTLLMRYALDAVNQSQFECQGCKGVTDSDVLTYSFRMSGSDPDPCCCTGNPDGSPKPDRPLFQISQSENHITITAAPFCICPDSCSVRWAASQSRFRAPSCFYLWKCGHRVVTIQ